MPRLMQTVPRYRKHRASGQAVVTIGGKDCYLGPYGTKASKVEYDRLIAEWLANDRQPILTEIDQQGLAIKELLTRYWKHAERHYRRGGKQTGSLDQVKFALRPLRKLYGHRLVADFGPRALKAIRQHLVSEGLSRGVVNKRIGIIKQVFKWGVAEELVPPSVHQAISAVVGLQKGRSEARTVSR